MKHVKMYCINIWKYFTEGEENSQITGRLFGVRQTSRISGRSPEKYTVHPVHPYSLLGRHFRLFGMAEGSSPMFASSPPPIANSQTLWMWVFFIGEGGGVYLFVTFRVP